MYGWRIGAPPTLNSGERSQDAKPRAQKTRRGNEMGCLYGEFCRTAAPSCLETHRGALGLWKYLRSRASAMLLSMGASTNPRLYGMTVASVSLFPACYLQRTPQLQRVERVSGL